MTSTDPIAPKTSAPFDRVAGDYDSTFGGWPAARFFRFRLINRIERRAQRGSSLLDIGSGTGEDAVWLASAGFKVLGIDPSAGMVEVARAKAIRVRSPAEFLCADFASFAAGRTFDVVYSNFGAMNCVPLEAWAGPLSRLLRPGGRAFLVVMGPRPLPERLLFGRGAWEKRRQPDAPVDAEGSIRVNYPGPKAIALALSPMFGVEGTQTLGAVVPPPGASNWPRRNPILFGLLAAIETVVSRRRMLCEFSDHFLIELIRR